MPSNYYCSQGGTSDEAAWLINFQTFAQEADHSAIELGYFAGTWPYPGTSMGEYFSYPQGYDTIENGKYGSIVTGELPSSTPMFFGISGAGGTYANSTTFFIFDYGTTYLDAENLSNYVSEPRSNFSQAEVTEQTNGATCWMGGNNGTGTTVEEAAYQPYGSSDFSGWGTYDYAANSPTVKPPL